jgi:hypothetical protein
MMEDKEYPDYVLKLTEPVRSPHSQSAKKEMCFFGAFEFQELFDVLC